MSELQELLNTLEQQVRFDSIRDGFPAEELRRNALETLKSLELGKKPHGHYSFTHYNDVEKIRMEYLHNAGTMGAELAKQYMADKIMLETDHFLFPVINAGLEDIGRDIMRSYAAEIYPLLRINQLLGKKEPDFPVKGKAERKKFTYGFTVETDRDIYDLNPIQVMTDPPGSHVFYDDVCERHIETFIFQSIEDADSAYGGWQNFIGHKVRHPPVKYAVRIETDLDNEVSVSTVIHADPFETSRKEFTDDGASVELLVCDSLVEAEKVRAKKLKEKRKTVIEETSAITPPAEKPKTKEIGKERSRSKEAPARAKKENRKHMPISK